MFALSFSAQLPRNGCASLRTSRMFLPPLGLIKILVSAFCALFLFVGANNFLSSRIIQNSLVSHTHSNTCQRPTTKAQTLASAMVCAPQSDSESCTMGYANLPQAGVKPVGWPLWIKKVLTDFPYLLHYVVGKFIFIKSPLCLFLKIRAL